MVAQCSICHKTNVVGVQCEDCQAQFCDSCSLQIHRGPLQTHRMFPVGSAGPAPPPPQPQPQPQPQPPPQYYGMPPMMPHGGHPMQGPYPPYPGGMPPQFHPGMPMGQYGPPMPYQGMPPYGFAPGYPPPGYPQYPPPPPQYMQQYAPMPPHQQHQPQPQQLLPAQVPPEPHSAGSIPTPTQLPPPDDGTPPCPTHPGDWLTLYCASENAMACPQCVASGRFPASAVVPARKALETAQAPLRAVIAQGKDAHQSFESAVAQMTERIKSLPASRDKAEATIRRACDEVRASVTKREEALLTRLRVLDTESQGRLRKQAAELLEVQAFLSDCVLILSNAAAETDPSEFFSHKTIVDKMVAALHGLEPPQIQAPVDLALVSVDPSPAHAAISRLELATDAKAAAAARAAPRSGAAALPPPGPAAAAAATAPPAAQTGQGRGSEADGRRHLTTPQRARGSSAGGAGRGKTEDWVMPSGLDPISDTAPFAEMNQLTVEFEVLKRMEKQEIRDQDASAPAPAPASASAGPTLLTDGAVSGAGTTVAPGRRQQQQQQQQQGKKK